MKTGALIIASLNLDKESRGNEDIPVFMPMQHLDGTTMIKREIYMLRKAGVTPIIVLCGYQQEVLKKHLSHNGVIFCEDGDYEKHSFAETLEIGLRFAQKHCGRILVEPVQYPAVARDTVEKLIGCRDNTVPVYQGRRGYPRLYVAGEPEAANAAVWERADCLETDDPGILYSLTDKDGFDRIRAYVKEQREANVLQMKLRVIFQKEEDFFNPEVCQLLRSIDDTGSIQAAAGRMHMSYSKCWKMINKVEEQMGFRFVDRVNGGKNGGKSSLTEDARIFLDRYTALTEDMERMSQNFFDVYFRDFQ